MSNVGPLMPFPLKFRELLETKPGDGSVPAKIWLSFAVCGAFHDSCGWAGWIGESVTDEEGKQLPAATEQICERCGKLLFRTAVSIKAVPATDQTPTLQPGVDYEVVPIQYE